MPEALIVRRLGEVRVRLRAKAAIEGATAGLALLAAVSLAGRALGLASAWQVSGVAVAILLAAGVARAGWRRATTPAAAEALERAEPGLQNLVVTAAEVLERPRPIREAIRAEIIEQASRCLEPVSCAGAVPLRRPALTCAVVWVGAALIFFVQPPPGRDLRAGQPGAPDGAETLTALQVRVTPPAYSALPEQTFDEPVQVTALAGSTVHVEVASGASAVYLDRVGRPSLALASSGNRFVTSWEARESWSLTLRPDSAASSVPRFLSVVVTPDRPPSVRIRAPGKDLALTGATGTIDVLVEGADEVGLRSMAVRYMRASGGGESVSFSEGEIPIRVTRQNPRQWTASASWALGGLRLEEGDVLVYRAMARDTNPGGVETQSEAYLIEVGRSRGGVSAGFAIPLEEKPFAVSQQMVVYKTEQLLAARAKHAADWLEQTQGLGVEQRMVRAEVVFLSGGVVEDEVAEAEHSHELAEGRLENAGRAEMLRAINAMSRAEAELIAGRAVEALVFERQALRSLELAFDRRRYFLRTLGERSRIDPSRRLSGDRADARSWTREAAGAPEATGIEAARQLMRDLAVAVPTDGGGAAVLAARVVAVDGADADLQRAALELASASAPRARGEALATAMEALAGHAGRVLAAAPGMPLEADPWAGRLAEQLQRQRAAGAPR